MATETGERSEVPEAPVEPHNALTHRFPVANLTVLSHFYRGELARRSPATPASNLLREEVP